MWSIKQNHDCYFWLVTCGSYINLDGVSEKSPSVFVYEGMLIMHSISCWIGYAVMPWKEIRVALRAFNILATDSAWLSCPSWQLIILDVSFIFVITCLNFTASSDDAYAGLHALHLMNWASKKCNYFSGSMKVCFFTSKNHQCNVWLWCCQN